MNKKQQTLLLVLLTVIIGLLAAIALCLYLFPRKPVPAPASTVASPNSELTVTAPDSPDETSPDSSPEVPDSNPGEWNIGDLSQKKTTVIEHEILLDAYIENLAAARLALVQYGEEQRLRYDNPEVKAIELRLQDEYGIFAVNLGEMDLETARDVERAVDYMYSTYPILQGTLTNLTLANLNSASTGHLALTNTIEYVINGSFAIVPFVVKHQILLDANNFLKRDILLRKCDEGVASGHWPEGTDITTLVVHELGHQVLNAVEMQHLGYTNVYYITEDNQDPFSYYITDKLSANQTFSKALLEEAYAKWSVTHAGTYEDFCGSISGYAKGIQSDGGISYPETVAEALADIYLHGCDAAEASRIIEELLLPDEY